MADALNCSACAACSGCAPLKPLGRGDVEAAVGVGCAHKLVVQVTPRERFAGAQFPMTRSPPFAFSSVTAGAIRSKNWNAERLRIRSRAESNSRIYSTAKFRRSSENQPIMHNHLHMAAHNAQSFPQGNSLPASPSPSAYRLPCPRFSSQLFKAMSPDRPSPAHRHQVIPVTRHDRALRLLRALVRQRARKQFFARLLL